MTEASMELVERLYRRLLESASEWPPEDAGSLTIADLYQHLIPYRGVRHALGVLELAQYEHALLRLLAGEGGFLRVLDEDVRRELASELMAPNPILGIYRDYAAVEVELREPVGENGRAAPPPFDADLSSPAAAAYGVSETAGEVEPIPPPLMPADAVRVAPAPSAPATEPATCVACREPLPDVEGLRFCPHCGADQTGVACGSCGALIRETWNFCIRCGAARPASPADS